MIRDVRNLGGIPGGGSRWVEVLRRPPLGVLLAAAVLALAGGGFVVGAVYLALERGNPGWVPLLGGLGMGPVALYVAWHLMRLTHWAWLAIILVVALLILSSVWRLIAAPPPPVVPITEIAIEVLTLIYFCTPRVRAAFTRR